MLEVVAESDKQRFALLHKPSKKVNDSESASETGRATEPLLLSEKGQENSTNTALEIEDPDPSNYLIRATQGHSIKTIESASYLVPVSLDNPASLPTTVVHGTFHAAWPTILATGGLKPMNRVHIHFATGPPLASVMPEDGPEQTELDGDGQVISGMRGDAQILMYVNLRRALEGGVAFWRSDNGVILSEGLEGKVKMEFLDIVVERKEGLGVLWKDGQIVKSVPEHLVQKGMPKGVHWADSKGRQGGKQKGKGNGKGKGKASGKPSLHIGDLLDEDV